MWLPAQSPARVLFGTARAGKLLFLAPSVGYAKKAAKTQGGEPNRQVALGRLSRALPLFLAESAFLHLGLETTGIVPWVSGHGFAVLSAEWTDADAAEHARSAGAVAAVTLHLQEAGERTESRLRVVPTHLESASSRMHAVSAAVGREHMGDLALRLWSRMAHDLLHVSNSGPDGSSPDPMDAARYGIPAGTALGNYLLGLEQLLAMRCAGSEPGFSHLRSKLEIVRGQLNAALSLPESLPLRLILHETLLRLRELGPEVLEELREPVAWLQRTRPLPDAAANAVLERQLSMIYPA